MVSPHRRWMLFSIQAHRQHGFILNNARLAAVLLLMLSIYPPSQVRLKSTSKLANSCSTAKEPSPVILPQTGSASAQMLNVLITCPSCPSSAPETLNHFKAQDLLGSPRHQQRTSISSLSWPMVSPGSLLNWRIATAMAENLRRCSVSTYQTKSTYQER